MIKKLITETIEEFVDGQLVNRTTTVTEETDDNPLPQPAYLPMYPNPLNTGVTYEPAPYWANPNYTGFKPTCNGVDFSQSSATQTAEGIAAQVREIRDGGPLKGGY